MVTPKEIDPRVFRASALAKTPPGSDRTGSWSDHRLIEISGTFANATTSTAVAAVVDAQQLDDVVVWVQPQHGSLFPPDLAESGVDLDALAVVHVPNRAAGRERPPCHDLPKAAELLLRSGAFDLLVLDWRPLAPPRGAWLVRLQALAREHGSRVLLLTDARRPIDAGCALVLRIEAERRRVAGTTGPFAIEPRVRRDKRGAVTSPPTLLRDGPAGLA